MSSPRPAKDPAWREVLDQIDRALQELLARANEPQPAPPPPDRPAPDPLGPRLAALEARLEQVSQEAAGACTEIGEAVEALEGWLREVAALRHRPAGVACAPPAA
jgi:hypothetical protein